MKMSDRSLRALALGGQMLIEPEPMDGQWQPCSVDLLLGTSFKWLEPGYRLVTDCIVLPPHTFLLATTKETVWLDKGFMGQVHGKSSWARKGLAVESAGLVDPGFRGQLTLELFNMSTSPIPLAAGKPICQLTVERLDWPADRPYGTEGLGSHYQGQRGATESHWR